MKVKPMKLKATLIPLMLAPLLVACGGGDKAPTADPAQLQEIAGECSRLSGFDGPSTHVPEMGITFTFRSDEAAIAECEWTSVDDVELIGLLK